MLTISEQEILSMGFKPIRGTDHYATGGLEATTPNYLLTYDVDDQYKLSQMWTEDFVLYRSVQVMQERHSFELHKNEPPYSPYYWVPVYIGHIPTLSFFKELLFNVQP